ncbi:hypothetical protein ACJRO7_027960 [Eucalyptus globulus]|uniref:Alpha-1,3-mannosyl-glycoprotein 2-beta-N-acetylglucosaminyltransferase n=1 Tax=Eucalyptus globulus TaxID=34317 RepID=A0ABD3JTQ7_EUCGL
MRLFTTQSEYADRLAAASNVELIDQISMQQSRIMRLEEVKKRQDEEYDEGSFKGLQGRMDKIQTHVAAVVITACNHADYLERTIMSILKYPLFVFHDRSDPQVRKKALSYDQLTYMEKITGVQSSIRIPKPVQTERPWELIAYWHYKWALGGLFYKHNFTRAIIYLKNEKLKFSHQILYRSDFFPGLGWMLTRSTWNELSPKWPKTVPKNWNRDPPVCYMDPLGNRAVGVVISQYPPPRRVFLVSPNSFGQLGIKGTALLNHGHTSLTNFVAPEGVFSFVCFSTWVGRSRED